MATPRTPPIAVAMVAVFSRHTDALQWAKSQIEAHLGPMELISEPFLHHETSYYEKEMGSQLLKQLLVPRGLFEMPGLPDLKLRTNAWEQELARSGRYEEMRPVNIDPGYITLSKLVLASAKDRAHRIYLDHGIYAEECLYYVGGKWLSRPWTYPDYQRDDFHRFFDAARDYLKSLGSTVTEDAT